MSNKKILPFLVSLCLLLGFNACKFSPKNNTLPAKTENSQAQPTENTLQAPLKYWVRQGNNAQGKALFLMHGLGSNAENMRHIAQEIDPSWTVFSLEAPLSHGKGKSWYTMNLQNGVTDRNPNDIAQSTQKLLDFIAYTQQKYTFSPQEIYIGGFSQGSIMALNCGLKNPQLIKGMACFSGLLLPDIALQDLDKKACGQLKIFMAHGTNDSVITVEQARNAHQFLQQLAMPLTYKEYPITHQISPDVLSDFKNWLEQL